MKNQFKGNDSNARRESYAYSVETDDNYEEDFEDEDAEIIEEDDEDASNLYLKSIINNKTPPRLSKSKWERHSSPINEVYDDNDFIGVTSNNNYSHSEQNIIHRESRENNVPTTSSSVDMNQKVKSDVLFPPKVMNHDPAMPASRMSPFQRATPNTHSAKTDIKSTNSITVSASASNNKKKGTKVCSWIKEKKWVLGDKIGKGSFGEVFQE